MSITAEIVPIPWFRMGVRDSAPTQYDARDRINRPDIVPDTVSVDTTGLAYPAVASSADATAVCAAIDTDIVTLLADTPRLDVSRFSRRHMHSTSLVEFAYNNPVFHDPKMRETSVSFGDTEPVPVLLVEYARLLVDHAADAADNAMHVAYGTAIKERYDVPMNISMMVALLFTDSDGKVVGVLLHDADSLDTASRAIIGRAAQTSAAATCIARCVSCAIVAMSARGMVLKHVERINCLISVDM